MSKTTGKNRITNDRYLTPPWAIKRFVEEFPWSARFGDEGTIRAIEPAYGEGNIIRVLNEHPQLQYFEWQAIDIQEPEFDLPNNTDFSRNNFLDVDFGEDNFDLLITNPPFSLAMEYVTKGLKIAEHVILMLRLNFLGSHKRNKFFRENMPNTYVLPNRVSYTANGKADSCEIAWMHWDRENLADFGMQRILKDTPAEERKSDRNRIVGFEEFAIETTSEASDNAAE